MSGGCAPKFPPWLASAKEAMDKIMALKARATKATIFEAQHAAVIFENEARNDFLAHKRLRRDLIDFALRHPQIARAIGEEQTWADKAAAEQQSGAPQ